jgi:hypothetical protein
MAPGCDWAHHGPIEGGGSSGGVASERRRRGCGGAVVTARTPLRRGVAQGNKRVGEL